MFGKIGGRFDTGKKWASGTVASVSSSTASFKYVSHSLSGSNSTASSRYIEIPLEFKPNVIVVTAGNSDTNYSTSSFRTYMSVYSPNEPIYADSNLKTVKTTVYNVSSLSTTSYNYNDCNNLIDLGNGIYRIPVPANAMYNIRWIAYE